MLYSYNGQQNSLGHSIFRSPLPNNIEILSWGWRGVLSFVEAQRGSSYSENPLKSKLRRKSRWCGSFGFRAWTHFAQRHSNNANLCGGEREGEGRGGEGRGGGGEGEALTKTISQQKRWNVQDFFSLILATVFLYVLDPQITK